MIKYIRTNQEQENFYNLVGPFLGNRLVAKELGMPIWNDPNREWVVAVKDGRPIGCCSIEFLKTKHKATLKSAWIEEEYRKNGIYQRMLEERIKIAKESGVKMLTATVTDKSKNTLIKNDFEQFGTRGKYYLMRKELD